MKYLMRYSLLMICFAAILSLANIVRADGTCKPGYLIGENPTEYPCHMVCEPIWACPEGYYCDNYSGMSWGDVSLYLCESTGIYEDECDWEWVWCANVDVFSDFCSPYDYLGTVDWYHKGIELDDE